MNKLYINISIHRKAITQSLDDEECVDKIFSPNSLPLTSYILFNKSFSELSPYVKFVKQNINIVKWSVVYVSFCGC